jgi:chromatin remodeling complex protein RSC6
MSSPIEIETAVAEKHEFNSVETIKSLLTTLSEQGSVIKAISNGLRAILKETEKNSKELDKLRNKKTRVKAERSPNALPSGITKPVAISDELAKFLGVAPGTLVPRNEVTKGVSGYVKKNDLSDPTNRQKFILDERPAAKTLRALLGNPVDSVTYFNLQRYLKHHYITDGSVSATPSAPKKKVKEPVPETPAPVAPAPVKVMKKVLVKKKVSGTELAEEA